MGKKIIVLYTSFKSGDLRSFEYLVSYHLSILRQRALKFLVGRKVWVTELESLNWNFRSAGFRADNGYVSLRIPERHCQH